MRMMTTFPLIECVNFARTRVLYRSSRAKLMSYTSTAIGTGSLTRFCGRGPCAVNPSTSAAYIEIRTVCSVKCDYAVRRKGFILDRCGSEGTCTAGRGKRKKAHNIRFPRSPSVLPGGNSYKNIGSVLYFCV